MSNDVISAKDAAHIGLRSIADLTSRTPLTVTSVVPAEEGWVVGVEVIEDHRVPSTADMLALYEIEIDAAGTVLAWERKRKYPRGSAQDVP